MTNSPPLTQISIQEIIQIRAILGSEEQVPTTATTEILDRLDAIILAFANDLNSHKGN